MPPSNILRGEIVWVELDPIVGAEMAKTRPCLVLQNDVLNAYSPLTTVTPLSSQPPKRPNPYLIAAPRSETGLSKDSWVSCNQVRTVSVQRVKGRAGVASAALMQEVITTVQKALGCIALEE